MIRKTLLTLSFLALSAVSSPALVVVISDLSSGSASSTIADFFTDNFINVTEIRHGNFANFSAAASQDALNGTGIYAGGGPADVFVIGRSLGSGEYDSGASDGYNALTIPFINFTSYTARQDGNRLGWHASGATGDKSVAGAETTVTAAGSTIFGVAPGTYDFYAGNPSNTFNGLGAGTSAYGDGQILATIGGDTLAAFWAAGDAPGNPTNAGVATFPANRLLFNLDNDPNSGNNGANDFTNLTPAGMEALVSAVAFATPLVAIPEPSKAMLSLTGLALLFCRRHRRC